MKTKLIYAVILVGAVTGAYYCGVFVGYNGHAESAAITGAIRSGSMELEEAKALRKGDIPGALNWIDTKLRSDLVTLRAFEKKVPALYKVISHRLRGQIEKYLKQHSKENSKDVKKESHTHR